MFKIITAVLSNSNNSSRVLLSNKNNRNMNQKNINRPDLYSYKQNTVDLNSFQIICKTIKIISIMKI